MGNMSFFNSLIERRLKDLHCGYIGKVVWTDGNTATVQPLGLYKETSNSAAKAQAVVSDVPVACRYKFTVKTIRCDSGSERVAVPVQIAAGDLVVCLCADWDITAARRGSNELPPAGMHDISDSIIVGIL